MSPRPWHRDTPALLDDLRERLRDAYPELHLVERDDLVVVRGVFPLTDKGMVIDRYQIEVELPRTYPKGLPVVRETDGRIPRTGSRHMESDGSACVSVPDEYWYRHPDGMDLLDFLSGPLMGYLVGQSLAELELSWPQGERGHGADGVAEFYGPLLGTTDHEVIKRFVEAIAARELRGHVRCPCGSGKRIRGCEHRALLGQLRARIPAAVAQRSLEVLAHERPKP